jgi:hypothetical protein
MSNCGVVSTIIENLYTLGFMATVELVLGALWGVNANCYWFSLFKGIV